MAGSDFWVSQVIAWHGLREHPLWSADLIIVETSLNDVSLTSKQTTKACPEIAEIQKNTELLVRLLSRSPAKPALLWLSASWRNFMGPPPYHNDASTDYLRILRYYHVPQVMCQSKASQPRFSVSFLCAGYRLTCWKRFSQ